MILLFTPDTIMTKWINHYFPQITKKLIDLLKEVEDPKYIEKIFHCLWFLFKYLVKQLVPDFSSSVIDLLIPFFDENNFPLQIINFASPGIAFLIRKLLEVQLIEILIN